MQSKNNNKTSSPIALFSQLPSTVCSSTAVCNGMSWKTTKTRSLSRFPPFSVHVCPLVSVCLSVAVVLKRRINKILSWADEKCIGELLASRKNHDAGLMRFQMIQPISVHCCFVSFLDLCHFTNTLIVCCFWFHALSFSLALVLFDASIYLVFFKNFFLLFIWKKKKLYATMSWANPSKLRWLCCSLSWRFFHCSYCCVPWRQTLWLQ